ncbi:MAG: hypothetical protein ACREV1_15105 [Gammaproteobacteria bacterium]
MLAETAPLPSQDRAGGHHDERRPPSGPGPGQPDPKEAICAAQPRPADRSLVHGELVAQGEVLQGEVAVVAAEDREESEQVAATRKCSDEGTGGVQVSPKLVERTQWVRLPTGEGVAAAPEPSLAG